MSCNIKAIVPAEPAQPPPVNLAATFLGLKTELSIWQPLLDRRAATSVDAAASLILHDRRCVRNGAKLICALFWLDMP